MPARNALTANYCWKDRKRCRGVDFSARRRSAENESQLTPHFFLSLTISSLPLSSFPTQCARSAKFELEVTLLQEKAASALLSELLKEELATKEREELAKQQANDKAILAIHAAEQLLAARDEVLKLKVQVAAQNHKSLQLKQKQAALTAELLLRKEELATKERQEELQRRSEEAVAASANLPVAAVLAEEVLQRAARQEEEKLEAKKREQMLQQKLFLPFSPWPAYQPATPTRPQGDSPAISPSHWSVDTISHGGGYDGASTASSVVSTSRSGFEYLGAGVGPRGGQMVINSKGNTVYASSVKREYQDSGSIASSSSPSVISTSRTGFAYEDVGVGPRGGQMVINSKGNTVYASSVNRKR